MNFNIFGGFQKNEYFLGMKILWILFWGLHEIGQYEGVISMHFMVFFKIKVRNGGILLGLLRVQIFFGVLEIADIFWGQR